MIFLNDHDIRNITSLKEAHDILSYRTANDQWYENLTFENQVIGVENNPICLESYKEDWKDQGKNFSEVSDDAIVSCMEDTGFFLDFATENGKLFYPIRYTALSSMAERAKLSGQTMTNRVEKPGIRVLSQKRKAELFTEALSLYDAKVKILIRDEKVSCMRSQKYGILNGEELVDAIEAEMGKSFTDFEFLGGEMNHEMFIIHYLLTDKVIVDRLRDILASIKFPAYNDVQLGITMITSDTGLASAQAIPFIQMGRIKLTLGNSISLMHSSGASIEKWEKEIARIAMVVKDTEEKFISLSQETINNPGGCLRNVASKIGLPKEASLVIGEEFDAEYTKCCALDVYYKLFEIAEQNEANNYPNGYSPAQRLRIEAQIAEALNLSFTQCDIPFEWKS